jgi:hypothetical protein
MISRFAISLYIEAIINELASIIIEFATIITKWLSTFGPSFEKSDASVKNAKKRSYTKFL